MQVPIQQKLEVTSRGARSARSCPRGLSWAAAGFVYSIFRGTIKIVFFETIVSKKGMFVLRESSQNKCFFETIVSKNTSNPFVRRSFRKKGFRTCVK